VAQIWAFFRLCLALSGIFVSLDDFDRHEVACPSRRRASMPSHALIALPFTTYFRSCFSLCLFCVITRRPLRRPILRSFRLSPRRHCTRWCCNLQALCPWSKDLAFFAFFSLRSLSYHFFFCYLRIPPNSFPSPGAQWDRDHNCSLVIFFSDLSSETAKKYYGPRVSGLA